MYCPASDYVHTNGKDMGSLIHCLGSATFTHAALATDVANGQEGRDTGRDTCSILLLLKTHV